MYIKSRLVGRLFYVAQIFNVRLKVAVSEKGFQSTV